MRIGREDERMERWRRGEAERRIEEEQKRNEQKENVSGGPVGRSGLDFNDQLLLY